jgi:hypothetical protein
MVSKFGTGGVVYDKFSIFLDHLPFKIVMLNPHFHKSVENDVVSFKGHLFEHFFFQENHLLNCVVEIRHVIYIMIFAKLFDYLQRTSCHNFKMNTFMYIRIRVYIRQKLKQIQRCKWKLLTNIFNLWLNSIYEIIKVKFSMFKVFNFIFLLFQLIRKSVALNFLLLFLLNVHCFLTESWNKFEVLEGQVCFAVRREF